MSNLKLKIGCTPEEIKEAQKLRFQIFNLEMNAGLSSSFEYGIDKDEFDEICEHVAIIDTKKDIMVGTYRMLLGSIAKANKGFYSEKEFNLEEIRNLKGGLLEVGRSCIHKDYRRKSVLSLLWQGIAQYAIKNRVRYIFGCSSVFTVDPLEVNQYFCALKSLGYFSYLNAFPVNKGHSIEINEHLKVSNPKEVFDRLSALFKGYMSLGLKVCGYPSADRDFKTTDFFVLLDIKNMNPSYKKRLFGDYLESEAPPFKETEASHANR